MEYVGKATCPGVTGATFTFSSNDGVASSRPTENIHKIVLNCAPAVLCDTKGEIRPPKLQQILSGKRWKRSFFFLVRSTTFHFQRNMDRTIFALPVVEEIGITGTFSRFTSTNVGTFSGPTENINTIAKMLSRNNIQNFNSSGLRHHQCVAADGFLWVSWLIFFFDRTSHEWHSCSATPLIGFIRVKALYEKGRYIELHLPYQMCSRSLV